MLYCYNYIILYYIVAVISHFKIQGGDIVNFNGTSGESIYGPFFEDENFTLKHESAGLLSMVNEGRPHTNNSQFIIILESSPHLDNLNVVFGKVVAGMGTVLEMSKVKTEKDDVPVEVRLLNHKENIYR